MKQLTRDGVRLAYDERGVGANPLLFIHGLEVPPFAVPIPM